MSHRAEEAVPNECGVHPLDQVIWRALTGVQRRFAEGDDHARRYPAAVARRSQPRSTSSLLP
jgi:hypothetical protein